MLQLRLLGRFAATIDSKPPIQINIRSKKGQALLAFLAVHEGHSASRDQLIALLWGDPADVHPRQNLRQCLISVRSNLAQLEPDFLAIDKDRIGLKSERLNIDAVDLAELAKSSDIADLERAAALYRGQFLADFKLGLRRFNDWLCTERSRFEAIAAHVLERCANRSDGVGGGERAIEAATQLLRLDPRREDWQRLLLRLYARYRGPDAAAASTRWLTEFVRNGRAAELAPGTVALIADIRPASIGSANPTAMLPTSIDIADCTARAGSQRLLQDGKVSTKVRPNKPSITVLPFLNLSADEALGYISRGIEEDIITALAKTKSYYVIAPTPICGELRQTHDARNAGYVLRGTVRRLGRGLQISARLVDLATGNHIWAQSYSCEKCDFLGVQHSICSNIVMSIEPSVYRADTARAARKPLHALDPHECVAMALSVAAVRTQQNYVLAQEFLSRAIALDPESARALSISASIAAMEVLWGWKPRTNLQCAFDAAQKALLIDEDDPWAHLALGWVLTQNRAPEAGVEEYYKVRALCPHFPYHSWLSIALGYLGHSERALAELDTAEHLGVRELFRGVNNSARASISFCAGRHEDAVLAARRSVLENPFLITSYRQLVVNYALTGEISKAREALGTFKRLVPNVSLQTITEALPNIRNAEHSKALDAFHSLGIE